LGKDRAIAYYSVPLADTPGFHQPIADVGVGLGKRLGRLRGRTAKYQHGSVGGVGQSAGHQQLAAIVGTLYQRKMLCAKRAAPVCVIVHHIIEQEEVHCEAIRISRGHGTLTGSRRASTLTPWQWIFRRAADAMGKSAKQRKKAAARHKNFAGKKNAPAIAQAPVDPPDVKEFSPATILVEDHGLVLERRAAQWTARAVALIGSISILLMGYFTQRHWSSEEPTLWNIVFTYLQDHRLALPAYGFWYQACLDWLFIHPPTHYVEIAWLMKAGIPLYYAQATPLIFFSILCLFLIVTSRFPANLQLGLATGVVFGMGWLAVTGGTDFSFHLRPDAHMAWALLAGLIALQASRVQNWENKRLFLGAFLMMYACTVHYPALFAWTGIVVFVFFAFRELPWRQSLRKVLLMAVAGGLTGIPYLFFFLLPNVPYLQQYSHYLSFAQVRQTITDNAPFYKGIYLSLESSSFFRMVYAWPLKEVARFSVPPFIVGVFLLLWNKQTRAIALGALPFTVFLFAISSRKFSPYYDLDCMLMLIGVWVWVATGWMKLGSFLTGRWRILAAPLFGLLVTGLLIGCTPEMANIRLKKQQHDYTMLRKLSKELMGPNALVAAFHPLWYDSGATKWFDLTNDLLMHPATVDPHVYWSRFDAVAMHHGTSWQPQSGVNEASLYVNGILRFRAFMGSNVSPEKRWIWMSPRAGDPVDGFVWRGGQLQRFHQATEGQYAIVSAVTTDEPGMLKTLSPIQYWDQDVPKAPGEQHQRELLFMLVSEQQFDSHPGIFTEGKPIEVIHGNLQTVDPNSFPEPSLPGDHIETMRSYPEMLPYLATAAPGSSRVPLQFREVIDGVLTKQAGSDAFRLRLDSARWGGMAIADIPKPIPGHYYQIDIDLEMKKGGARMQVLTDPQRVPLVTVDQEVPLKHASRSFVFQAAGSDPLKMSLDAWNSYAEGPFDVTVSKATIQEVVLSR